MNMIIWVVISVGIGALIGGLTNLLAIRMLFRPLTPIRLGNWQLPFTPGLIPKRREEIARNVGQIVEQHLFTSSALRHTFRQQAIHVRLTNWLHSQKERLLHTQWTLRDLLPRFGIEELPLRIKVNHEITERVYTELQAWIQSDDWQGSVQAALEQELRKGWFGSFMSGILPTAKLIEKIRALLLDWLYTQQAKALIQEKIGKGIEKELDQLLEQPVGEWLASLDLDRLVTQLGQTLYDQFEKNVESALRQLPLAEMVEEQVNALSLTELESLVYQLARKELKWITLLGAFIGALVGLLQGILYLSLSSL